MNPIVKYFIPPITIMSLHSATVLLRQVQHDEDVKKQQAILDARPQFMGDFRVGSPDDMVMDYVQTGDLVLFQRKWHYHHLPMGVLILLYRKLFDTEYDHVGVVLTDTLGKPYLLENTPYRGMQCRAMSDRIKQSEAEVITLIPFNPRDRQNTSQFLLQQSNEERRALIDDENEYIALSKSILKKIFQELKQKIDPKDVQEEVVDRHAVFLNTILPHLGIQPVSNHQTFHAYINKEVILQDNHHPQKNKIQFDRENILIRTR